MLSQESKIIIVGGGVFGLSTALWLARSGHRDITIFDRCAFDQNFYDPQNGYDGASADINKVFRVAYGSQKGYQDLAIEARTMWLAWNKQIQESTSDQLPPGLEPDDKLLHECGNYFIGEGTELNDFYEESLRCLAETAPEVRAKQFLKGNAKDEERLREIDPKWVEKLHLLDNINGGNTNGFLDTQCGITIADKACVYARYLCEKAGVKFVLGQPQGQFSNMIYDKPGCERKIVGIKTEDGRRHDADLVIVAAGGWTASIIPEASKTVETTAGTVMFVDIPKERQDLWRKFHHDNYPVWSYRSGQGDNYYQGGGFPISKQGRLKFGYRGRKFTNYENHPTEPGLRISTPRTKYTKETISTVPLHGLPGMKKVITSAFPELKKFGFTDSRLCWYNDSIDNNFVIDYVPGYSDSLFICTGGSGHAFKFLPILGRVRYRKSFNFDQYVLTEKKHVENQLERRSDQFTSLWKWRVAEPGKPNNGLLEGENGPRDMSCVDMANPRDFKMTEELFSRL